MQGAIIDPIKYPTTRLSTGNLQKFWDMEDHSAFASPSYIPAGSSSSSKFSVNRFLSRTSSSGGGSSSQHRSNDSISSSAPASVRVVGRGGVGSRPRALPSSSSSLPTVVSSPTPPRRVVDPSHVDTGSTRIMGRGGAGARPRLLESKSTGDLGAAAATRRVAPTPVPPLPTTSAQQPVKFRTTGRGGAGSRQPKAKPVMDGATKPMGIKSLWKGKAREEPEARTHHSVELDHFVLDVGTAGTSLMRTDSVNTIVSEIAFAPPPPGQLTRSATITHGQRSAASGLTSKLARTLGVSDPGLFGFDRPSRAMRRGSISTLSTLDSSYLDLTPSSSSLPTDSDARSDITTITADEYIVLDTSDTRTITSFVSESSSVGSGAHLHAHPNFRFSTDTVPISIEEPSASAGELEQWDRSATPTPPASVPGDEEKQSSFFVVSPKWQKLVVRDEPVHGWSGQWNRGDMNDVISGLRGLKS
ncbi:hypothetical protein FB45DRAFT_1106943 [Roridomyces roridus]|uniref:Uncharacterized protein n=1 Tax=Roridomyces roridus TaxID=1738132 RepID=A0AAD7BB49_9AGAR|nr:hypothetical protein FB45DRAFT_1106943 [Roridomyces roridus]